MHALNAPSKMKLINFFNVYYAFVLWLENNHKTQIFHKHCMHIWHTVNVCIISPNRLSNIFIYNVCSTMN